MWCGYKRRMSRQTWRACSSASPNRSGRPPLPLGERGKRVTRTPRRGEGARVSAQLPTRPRWSRRAHAGPPRDAGDHCAPRSKAASWPPRENRPLARQAKARPCTHARPPRRRSARLRVLPWRRGPDRQLASTEAGVGTTTTRPRVSAFPLVENGRIVRTRDAVAGKHDRNTRPPASRFGARPGVSLRLREASVAAHPAAARRARRRADGLRRSPAVGEQVVDVLARRGYSKQDVGQIRHRVLAIRLARCDERVEPSEALAGFGVPDE